MAVYGEYFEGGFYAYDGIGELTVPNGWTPTWVQGTEAGKLVRPEFKPAGAAQVRTGTGAVAIHSRYATIDGALFRRYSATVGAKTQAEAWLMKTEAAMGHGMQVGIDPTGGTDHTASGVVWSEWYSEYADDYVVNQWRKRSVSTTASADHVTVFLHSKLDAPADGSNAHFDDVLVSIEDGSVTPPIVPPGSGESHILTQVLLVDGVEVNRVDIPIRATMTLEIGGMKPTARGLLARIFGR